MSDWEINADKYRAREMMESHEDLAGPITILSDLHLDWFTNWRHSIDRLGPLWSGCRTVVFNGDTLNWCTAVDEARRQEVLGRLRKSCDRHQARAVFLAGNSDSALTHRKHLAMMGQRVLVTHGDAVFPDLSPWRRIAGMIGKQRQYMLQDMDPSQRDSLEGQLISAHAVMRKLQLSAKANTGGRLSTPPRERPWWRENPAGLKAILRAWRQGPKLAARFCRRFAPKAQVIVMGHTHRSGVWRIEGKTVVNTGSFGRFGRPAVVSLDRGWVVVRRISREAGGYVPGAVVASFFLSDMAGPAMTGRAYPRRRRAALAVPPPP